MEKINTLSTQSICFFYDFFESFSQLDFSYLSIRLHHIMIIVYYCPWLISHFINVLHFSIEYALIKFDVWNVIYILNVLLVFFEDLISDFFPEQVSISFIRQFNWWHGIL